MYLLIRFGRTFEKHLVIPQNILFKDRTMMIVINNVRIQISTYVMTAYRNSAKGDLEYMSDGGTDNFFQEILNLNDGEMGARMTKGVKCSCLPPVKNKTRHIPKKELRKEKAKNQGLSEHKKYGHKKWLTIKLLELSWNRKASFTVPSIG